MANLDEMSTLLGEIRSDIKHILRWQEEHEDADQARYEKLASRIDKSNGHAARIDALEVRTAEVKLVTDKLEKVGWMGRGVLITIGVLGGAGISGIALQLAKWF